MNVRIDARAAAAAYSQAFQKLKLLENFDHTKILRAEAGSILKAWASKTKVTTQGQADLRARIRLGRTFGFTSAGAATNYVSITAGTRRATHPAGTMWYRTKTNRVFKIGAIEPNGAGTVQWADARYGRYTPFLETGVKYADNIKTYVQAARASMGLSRQSVIQIADRLNIDLSQVAGGDSLSAAAISKARAAIASNGRAYVNGTGSDGGDTTKYYIQLLNTLPRNTAMGMDSTLAYIISGRAKYIETSYAKGAFDSMANVARAFPNIIRIAA